MTGVPWIKTSQNPGRRVNVIRTRGLLGSAVVCTVFLEVLIRRYQRLVSCPRKTVRYVYRGCVKGSEDRVLGSEIGEIVECVEKDVGCVKILVKSTTVSDAYSSGP